jgi:hypothetical protein
MKRKHLTETLVCPWERLVIISYTTGLSFALERIGPLVAIIITVFYLIILYLLALQNTPENLFASIYSESLIKTTRQHLLLLVVFDTLIYRKYYDTSLYLWVIRPMIHLKRIYNFWCSMLVLTPFSLCFVTLCGVFIHFLELTYLQDATVPVPYFLLFLCFKKVTQEIFSELDKTKAEPPIFTEALRRPKMRRRGARGQPHHREARPSPWPRPPMVRPPGPPPNDAPSPIKTPRREKPKGRISFPRNILQATAVVVAKSGGSTSRHPVGEGNPCWRPSTPPWSPPEWCVSSLPWTTGP